jgi:TetR/AcrR family transcriptional regulator, mexCD-oprJ operon repressor
VWSQTQMTGTSISTTGAPRHDRTATAILDAAAHLLAAPGSSANMAAVAAAAGVSRATLYRYFPHRQALLEALGAQALADAGSRLADAALERVPVEEAIERILRALLTVGDRYGVLVREQVKADPGEADRLVGAPLRAVFARGVESGALRQDIDPDVLVHLFGGAVQAALKLTEEGRVGIEEASAATASVFLDGARAR